jgi:hypothetical protein
LQKKWSDDIACGEGVFSSFDIDAKLNSAYVVMGLLYGNGDYSKSLDITTRAGQDADCNPSSVGGILGTMLGYKKIPAYWKMGLKDIEDMDFKYTTMSLNKVYEVGFKHALENIRRNGGSVDANNVHINLQTAEPVKLEQSFPNMYPVEKRELYHDNIKEASFEFEGTGFIIRGEAKKIKSTDPERELEAELYVDDVKIETTKLSNRFYYTEV